MIEEDYDVSLQVENIKIDAFGEFKIQGLLISDHHQDTLIYFQKAEGKLIDIHLIKDKIISFSDINIQNGSINDFVYPLDKIGSLTVFSSKFSKNKKAKNPLELRFNNTKISNFGYSFTKNNICIADFNQISGSIQKLKVIGSKVDLETDSLSFTDIYNINYKKIATHFKYSSSEMTFENTHLLTDYSDLYLNVVFNYMPSDFSNFIKKVGLKGRIEKGKLSIIDVNKIHPHFKHFENLNLSSNAEGTLNNLRLTDAKISSENKSLSLEGDLFLKNSIKNRDQVRFQITDGHVELKTNYIENFVPEPYSTKLPKDFKGVDYISYTGDLEVSIEKLIAKGELVTNLGKAKFEGVLNKINTETPYVDCIVFEGYMPKIKQIEGIKNIDFKGNIKGIIGEQKLNLKSYLSFKNLRYKKIKLSKSNLGFQINNKSFKADFESKDTLLTFKTKISKLTTKSKEEYDLKFDLFNAKINKVFTEDNFYQNNFKGTGEFKLIKNKQDFSLGGLISDFSVETEKDSISFSDIELFVNSKKEDKTISLKSKNIIDIEAQGKFNFEDLNKLVKNALYKFIPGSQERTNISNQTLTFELEAYPITTKLFTHDFWLDDNLKISGNLDSKGDKGSINTKIPSISSGDLKIDSLDIVLDNSNQWINSNVSIKNFKFKEQNYTDLSLLGKKINDTLFVKSDFKSDKINNRAIFYITTKDQDISVGIESVYFKYLKSLWVNLENKTNKINYNYNTGDWSFNEIAFANGDQEFEFGGSVRNDHSKNLKLALKKINLAEILPGIDSLDVGGIASGEVFFNEKNTLLKPNGSLTVNDLRVNGVDYGNMIASIEPNEKKLGYNIDFNISSKDTRSIDAHGEILLNEKKFLDSKIDLNVKLNKLKLSSLSPLGRNVLSAIRGKVKGAFTVSGSFNDFNSYGELELNESGLKFPYLNVDYNFKGDTKIYLKGKRFLFENIALEDAIYNTEGSLEGEINYDKFNNWNLDLNINSSNLLVLNTMQNEESKYFGTAFMRGTASIKGLTSDLLINVTGTTLPNTKFVLPLSDIKQVENNRFVYFKERKTEENIDEKDTGTVGGITVELNIEITKDALGEVVIDQSSGSSLQGRTDGNLSIEIDKLFNIKMYGDLIVDEGLYNFKYGGFVNKPFVMQKGGTVSWDGDPYEAKLNIEAIHSVKANPKVLLENLTVNRKIDVDLITKVTGELFNSQQEFFITIPNASSTVASELDFKLNIDENSKMTQFFSLLVTKSFRDENTRSSTSTIITNTTSELISNAVTQIFNKDDDKFKIDIGYTSGETVNVGDLEVDDQIDIGVATEINDRILINGKLGVPVGAKTQTTVVGEVKVEFLMNKDGSLRSSIFNRQNEIQYSEEEEGYTQGLGLSYQINFNNLIQLLQKIGLKEKKSIRDKKKVDVELTDDKLPYISPN